MPMRLPDGTVVPSYLGSEPMGASDPLNSFGNMSLRQGEVRAIIYPDDPKSFSKSVVEYTLPFRSEMEPGRRPS